MTFSTYQRERKGSNLGNTADAQEGVLSTESEGIPGLVQSRALIFKQREPPRSDRTEKRTPAVLQQDVSILPHILHSRLFNRKARLLERPYSLPSTMALLPPILASRPKTEPTRRYKSELHRENDV